MLVLTDQPGLKLESSDKYLVVKELYGVTLDGELAVLDIQNNKVIVARRNNSSPVQKWIVTSTGNNRYFNNTSVTARCARLCSSLREARPLRGLGAFGPPPPLPHENIEKFKKLKKFKKLNKFEIF